MQINIFKVLSLVFSIIMVLPQVPGVIVDYVQNTSTQTATQFERLEKMRNEEISMVDEQSFANFDLNDDTVKYNEVRTLITHNSYKLALSESLISSASQLFGPEEFMESMYEHDTPVAQLNNGVRGLELDVRYQTNGFKIFHVPLVDNLTNSPDWKMTLEELCIWSDANPNHVPVTILMEMKDDPIIANLMYREMNEKRFEELDDTVRTIMGEDKVVTASDLMGDKYSTLAEVLENDDWPTLSEVKGKFIFLLHPHDEYTDMYINMDTTLKSQMFIPVIRSTEIESHYDNAAFVMCNTPNVKAISELVSNHYIVRTRMDSNLTYDESRKTKALASGAQLISTDLEEGVILPKLDYVAYLKDEYTIILND